MSTRPDAIGWIVETNSDNSLTPLPSVEVQKDHLVDLSRLQLQVHVQLIYTGQSAFQI